MRYGAVLSLFALAGCEITPVNAPIAYKISQANGEEFDGVELSVLCELADRIGTDYQAADIDDLTLDDLEQQLGNLTLLSTDEVFCGGKDEPIGLPFTVDPQRRLISTWSEFSDASSGGTWGTCIADTARPEGNRVILCEIGDASAGPSLPFNLNPDQTDRIN
ncbi:MAG: hypothetical protein AAF768_07920 [Pseudomonadota bacterium]